MNVMYCPSGLNCAPEISGLPNNISLSIMGGKLVLIFADFTLKCNQQKLSLDELMVLF